MFKELKTQLEPVRKGLYLSPRFGYEPSRSWVGSRHGLSVPDFGVCDSPEQFMKCVGDEIESRKEGFCVVFKKVLKEYQPPVDGWRWEKWGAYIGDHEPTADYLYHEDVIEEVYVYSIYRHKGSHGC